LVKNDSEEGTASMPDFGDIEREARRLLGPEMTEQLKRRLAQASEDEGVRHIVSASNVDFRSQWDEARGHTASQPPSGDKVPSVEGPKSESKVVLPGNELVDHAHAQQTDEPASTRHERQNAPDPPAGSHSRDVIAEAIKGEYAYAKLGLMLGLASIVGGVVMGLHGVGGHTSWTASFLGLNSQINDAAPGVVLFVVGLFMIRTTKPKVNLKDLKG
jgi:hypothetical protein